jgi:hypothetical protein
MNATLQIRHYSFLQGQRSVGIMLKLKATPSLVMAKFTIYNLKKIRMKVVMHASGLTL